MVYFGLACFVNGMCREAERLPTLQVSRTFGSLCVCMSVVFNALLVEVEQLQQGL